MASGWAGEGSKLGNRDDLQDEWKSVDGKKRRFPLPSRKSFRSKGRVARPSEAPCVPKQGGRLLPGVAWSLRKSTPRSRAQAAVQRRLVLSPGEINEENLPPKGKRCELYNRRSLPGKRGDISQEKNSVPKREHLLAEKSNEPVKSKRNQLKNRERGGGWGGGGGGGGCFSDPGKKKSREGLRCGEEALISRAGGGLIMQRKEGLLTWPNGGGKKPSGKVFLDRSRRPSLGKMSLWENGY